jgi:hypothetical protein
MPVNNLLSSGNMEGGNEGGLRGGWGDGGGAEEPVDYGSNDDSFFMA